MEFGYQLGSEERSIGECVLTTKTSAIPKLLVQAFFRVSTQISPVLDIFGWNIFVIIVPVIVMLHVNTVRKG
jgi:hypothetical protein